MGLRDVGEKLPPGFRFYPSDEELVCHYLLKKIANEQLAKGTLVEIDLHVCEPWQLPDVAKLNSSEWYFFSFRDRKYATGYRTNRATTSGYWKATGKDRSVLDPNTRSVVGMRKTLVFYRNRAPNGIKTGWIMHEFRLENPHLPPKEDWVLCRVFYKSRLGSGENSNMSHDHLHVPTCPNLVVYASPSDNQHQNNMVQFPNSSQNPNNITSLPALLWGGNRDVNEADNNKTGALEMTKCGLYDEYGMFILDFDEVPSSMEFDQNNGSSVFM